ncbi:MAG: hypothetical protein ING19_02820 [Azospirillum sp.]|nr:hypothetical protein [Azospirillum sp.]
MTRKLLASTALALFATIAAAHAQTPAPASPTQAAPTPKLERGIVRIEAHPNSERQRLHPSELALFSGTAKIENLGFDSVAAFAPPGLTPFVSLLPVRVRATLSLEPGNYRLGVWIPEYFRFSRSLCKLKIETSDGDPIFDGVVGDGTREKTMSEAFALDEKTELEVVYDIVCSYQPSGGSGSLRGMPREDARVKLMIARGDEQPRELTPREISAKAMPTIARTLGQRRPEPPKLADGMRTGWRVEHRAAAFAPLFGADTLEEKWAAVWRAPIVATIAAPGPSMAPPAAAPSAPQAQRVRDTASSAIVMTSNLLVTEDNAGTTWLALSAGSNSKEIFPCWSEAVVNDRKLENESRHAPLNQGTFQVVFPADGRKHLAGAWLLPDLAPGAYSVRISIACATTTLTIAGGDVNVLLKRSNDRALRLPNPGEFVVEK